MGCVAGGFVWWLLSECPFGGGENLEGPSWLRGHMCTSFFVCRVAFIVYGIPSSLLSPVLTRPKRTSFRGPDQRHLDVSGAVGGIGCAFLAGSGNAELMSGVGRRGAKPFAWKG